MKKDDKKRLTGRPCASKTHVKSQIKDKQSEYEVCNDNEDIKEKDYDSKKNLGKRAQMEPLNFEIKNGGPAKIQKLEINNQEMPADYIIEKEGSVSESSPEKGNLGFFDDVDMYSEACQEK